MIGLAARWTGENTSLPCRITIYDHITNDRAILKTGFFTMDPSLDGIDKILSTKTVEKFYDDAASAPSKELSKIGVDVVKTARLFLAPFQLTAAFQDRFERFVERVRNRVPEDRYVEPPAALVGPAIQNMQFLDEDNPLWVMFEELLICAVDSEKLSKVHPSFSHTIALLSPDEARILYRLREVDFTVVDNLDLNEEKDRFENRRIEKSDIPTNELHLPDQIDLYYSHLESLSLVAWPVEKQDPIRDENKRQMGIRRFSRMQLTEFGRLFVSACIPDDGFE